MATHPKVKAPAPVVDDVPETVRSENPAPRYGMGYIPDNQSAVVASSRARFGAPVNLPTSASIEQHVRRIKDQGQTSSCVGQALSTAIDTRLRALGVEYGEPSALGAYTLGRTLDKSLGDKLVDDGSRPFYAVSALRKFGIPTEAAWPFDPYRVNDDLPFDVLLSANKAKIGALYKVDSYGASRSQDVRLALSKGFPLMFAIPVDAKFQSNKGEVVGPMSGPEEGWHMLCLVGYRTVNGVVQFRGVNSWGTSWGDNGMFWLSEARLYTAKDIYAVEVQS